MRMLFFLFAITTASYACAPAPKPAASEAASPTTPSVSEAPAVATIAATEPSIQPEPAPVKSVPASPASPAKNAPTPPQPSAPVSAPAAPIQEAIAFSHEKWDQLLRKHVGAEGKVNYKGFLADKADLETYLTALSAGAPQKEWSRREQMAWWINAYNAFTIKLILDNYPVSSITKLHGGKPWDVKWIDIGGEKYSLNQIENDILRPRYKDARIHFALNCAARSCPPLLNRAWTADNLESLLDRQTRQFVNNPKFNRIEAGQAAVSKIFDWYAADFGSLPAFINKYSTAPMGEGAGISFQEYDWGLNE
jgi:hypothetical protein